MKVKHRSKFQYKKAFKLSLLVNALLVGIGVILLIKLPVKAEMWTESIGNGSYNLYMTNNDIVYIYCNTGSNPNLGSLSNQMALTCPK